MVFEEEATSVSPVDTEEFTLQNKSPLSCPLCPSVSLFPSRSATPAVSPIPSLTQAQAFNLNKNNILCLPVFSVDNKVVWVRSNSIAQEVAHAADALYRAFGVFPYPKRLEMVRLARRCSLHVDHVRVWFMFQRLHYGISWDQTDILNVRKRLFGPAYRRPAATAKAAAKTVAKAAKTVAKAAKTVAKTAKTVGGEVEEEEAEEEQGQPRQEGRVGTPDQPRKRKLVEEKEKGKTAKKRTRERKVDKMSARDKGDRARVRKGAQSAEEDDPPKRSEASASADRGRAQDDRSTTPAQRRLEQEGEPGPVDEGMALLSNREPVPESTATPTPPPVSSVRRPHRRYRKKNTPFDRLPKVQVSESPLASEGHTGPLGTGENDAGRKADSTATMSGEDGVAPADGSAHGNTPALGDLDTSKAKARPPVLKPTFKTKEQLNQLHRAFLACPYPNPRDYDQLSEWTGLQRIQLLQWFRDMRFTVKDNPPCWITPRDRQRVIAHMQRRNRLHVKMLEVAAGRETRNDPGAGTWRLKLEEQSPDTTPTTTPTH